MTTALTPFGTRYPQIFDDFRREMDSLMSRFFDGGETGVAERSSWFNPLCNVSETDNEFEVSVELPGSKPDDFNVELRHGDLWITGERKQEHEESRKNWHRVERHYGQFQRVIRLGADVDPDQINAEYKNGVLRITVPKSETSRPKRIEVKG